MNSYSEKIDLDKDLIPWSVEHPSYNPPEYTAKRVFENDCSVREGGWADPPDVSSVDFSARSTYCGPLSFDSRGRPQNPQGRMGLAGRGYLGKWGPNHAADNILVRLNPQTKKREVLVIRRGDNNKIALPGGMIDDGETALIAAARELIEEALDDTTTDLSEMTELIGKGRIVYTGYIDDSRNTDHAWIETTAFFRQLSEEEAEKIHLKEKEGVKRTRGEIKEVFWMNMEGENLNQIHANHRDLIEKAM